MTLDFREEAKKDLQRIILCEPDERIVKAARILKDEQLCEPVLVGDGKAFVDAAREAGVSLDGIKTQHIDPSRFADEYHELRKHKDITREDAAKTLEDPAFYSCMLLRADEADGVVCGATWPTANTIRPALRILRDGLASSYFLMRTSKGDYVFADCALNIQPSADELAQIAENTAKEAERLGFAPRIAMLSFSTQGSAHHEDQEKVMHATQKMRERIAEHGDWVVSGEIQVDAALDEAVDEEKAPQDPLHGHANILVFPDLDAGNIGYKLVERYADAEAVGPILTGFTKPINDLSRGSTVEEIVDVACVTAWQANRQA